MPRRPVPDGYLTVETLAKLLDVHVNTVRLWHGEGRLPAPAALPGKALCWTDETIDEWLKCFGDDGHLHVFVPKGLIKVLDALCELLQAEKDQVIVLSWRVLAKEIGIEWPIA